MNIRILTDSTSDITNEQAIKKNITVVPLRVSFGNEEYKDGENLTSEQFYEKLKNTNKLPITSQPSPEEFLLHFEEAKQKSDTVIVITLSSKLSGTYQSALLAKNMCDYDNIYLVDSSTVTLGLKLLVDYAIVLRDQGKSAEDIINILEKEKNNISVLAVVDTLEYLKKGGRLSSTAAFAGTLLNIKPIIKVKDGEVSMAAKARGTNSAFSKLKALIDDNGNIDFDKPYTLGYTGDRHTLDPFLNFIESSYSLSDLPISTIGCTVGVHAGPGACGIAYFNK